MRVLTNTTRRPLRVLVDDLGRFGLAVSAGEMFTPAVATRHVPRGGWVPHLFVHPGLRVDFEDPPHEPGSAWTAVVVGDAGGAFSQGTLDEGCLDRAPTHVVDDLARAVDWLLEA